MVIQWCLKGIEERASFGDKEAADLLNTGIKSTWLFNNAVMPIAQAIPTVQGLLSETALISHVNNYAAVRTTSPYISLSAGVVLPHTPLGTRVFPAWKSAVDFATHRGKVAGYVYRLWTIVTSKPSPRLMNVSDEIRNLNLFRAAWKYQHQGEITAKLVIPPVQIESVVKIGADGRLTGFRADNSQFVKPDSISNLLEEINA
jgi:hypothetical protein